MKTVYCPKCGKQLIRLEPYESDDEYEFWCDACDIDIRITDNKIKRRVINHEKTRDSK